MPDEGGPVLMGFFLLQMFFFILLGVQNSQEAGWKEVKCAYLTLKMNILKKTFVAITDFPGLYS